MSAGHLQYNSSNGHLLYNSSTGHLSNECGGGCACLWDSETCYWVWHWSAEWWCGSGFINGTPNFDNGNYQGYRCLPCCIGGNNGCDGDGVVTEWEITNATHYGPNGFYGCNYDPVCIELDTWYVREISVWDPGSGLPLAMVVDCWTRASTPEECTCGCEEGVECDPSSAGDLPPATFTPDPCICNGDCC